MLRGSFATGALLLLMAVMPTSAFAKTPGYVLGGGDLGAYAIAFFTDDYIERPNADAEVVPMAFPIGETPSYIYSDRPFATADEVVTGRPVALLYPAGHFVYNTATDTWLHLSDRLWFGQESWSGVQKAIDKAHAGISHTTLADGPVSPRSEHEATTPVSTE
jgi:hypothetical protein